MNAINPFYYAYISEQVKNPEEFFHFFSFNIFQKGTFRISTPMNHFILGAQGFGKTMFLRFFYYKNQSYIHNNGSLSNFYNKNFGDRLPKKFAGIYYTASLGPYTKFSGRGISSEKWASFYGHYLNLVIFEEMLRLLFYCTTDEGKNWGKAMGINSEENKITKAIEKILKSGDLYNELFCDCEKSNNCHDFHKSLIDSISTCHRIVSKQEVNKDDIPAYQIEPGRLLIDFIKILRDDEVLDGDTRLFILFDEYQELGLVTENSLLPRVINTAIKTTARTPISLIEYKIGTRRYGLKEYRILGSETKIERDREYDLIDLENAFLETGGFEEYRKFIKDITAKRLESSNYNINYSFSDLFSTPSRKDDSNLNEFFDWLKQKAKEHYKYNFENLEKEYKDVFNHPPPDGIFNRIVSMMLLLKAIKKYEKAEIEKDDIKKDVEKNRTEEGWRKEATEVYSFTRANINPMSGKKYFGYDTLIRMSYPVVLNYLRLCKKLFELVDENFEDVRRKHLSKEKQSMCVKIVAEEMFDEIATKTPSGSKLQLVLSRLGILFRGLHKLIPAWLIISCEIDKDEYDKSDIKDLISEAIDYSLLHKEEKVDKKHSKVIISFNKMLCPCFNLSVYPEEVYISLNKDDLIKLISDKEYDWNETKRRLINEFLKPSGLTLF